MEEREIPHGFFSMNLKALLPSQFMKIFRKYVPGYSIEAMNPEEKKIPGIFIRQLKNGIPVPILLSTENVLDMETMYIHYSTVIGIDNKKDTVTLANPFGYEEVIGMERLIGMMSYKNYKERPFKVRLALFLGLVKPNTLFIIEKEST